MRDVIGGYTNDYVWRYKIPCNPISVNEAYRIGSGGSHKFLFPWMWEFKDFVLRKMKSQDSHRRKPHGEGFVCSYLFVWQKDEFYFKNGTRKKLDVSNYFKLLEDAVFSYLGLDDGSVFDIHGYKRFVDKLPTAFQPYSNKETKEAGKPGRRKSNSPIFRQANIYIAITEFDPKKAHLYDARLWTMMPDSKLEFVRRAGKLDELETLVRQHCIDDVGFRAVMASIDSGLMGKDLMNKINLLIENAVVRNGIFKPLSGWLNAFKQPPDVVPPPLEAPTLEAAPAVPPPVGEPKNTWRRGTGGFIFHEFLWQAPRTKEEIYALADGSKGALSRGRAEGLLMEYFKSAYLKGQGWSMEQAESKFVLVATYPNGEIRKGGVKA